MTRFWMLVVTVWVLSTAFAAADIIHVPGDFQAIQTAIDSSLSGDTVLVESGTYYEIINFNGHNVVLGSLFLTTGDQSYISSTIIDGNQLGRVVTFENGENQTAAIIGFTVQLGFHDTSGAGIYIVNSSPTIAHNILYSNLTFGFGGGIYCFGSQSVIQNNVIVQNIARQIAGHGGGIACVMSDVTILNNTLIYNSSDLGGGIFSGGGDPIITNCIVWGNLAPVGSQMILESGNATVSYCDVEEGWTGEGNINVDPVFKNNGYHLKSLDCGDTENSPCIDTGDPYLSDLILDCSWGLGGARSDIGAFGGGNLIATGIGGQNTELPVLLEMTRNYPNPFNASTTISYTLASESEVTLEIYDLLGKKIESFNQGFQLPGQHSRVWKGDNLSSGIYYYTVRAGAVTYIGKMTLLK